MLTEKSFRDYIEKLGHKPASTSSNGIINKNKMNIKKELNDFHKQMEEDFYPLDPVFFYIFIPFGYLCIFIYVFLL